MVEDRENLMHELAGILFKMNQKFNEAGGL